MFKIITRYVLITCNNEECSYSADNVLFTVTAGNKSLGNIKLLSLVNKNILQVSIPIIF